MRSLHRQVDAGFGKAARYLGKRGRHYRIDNGLEPLSNLLGTPMLCFDADPGFPLRKPRMWGKSMTYALTDCDDARIDDLLEIAGRFYFIIEIEPFRPPLCVACNNRISIIPLRGKSGPVVKRCPASLVLSGHGETVRSGMPGSLRPGEYVLHMPKIPGSCLMPYMQVTDEIGARYLVSSVELSENGVRACLSMQQV